MSEKILVTGDSGFVGGSILKSLRTAGHATYGVSWKGEIDLDIASPDFIQTITKVVPPCSIIIHAAASLDKDLYAREVTRVNCVGIQNILELNKTWNSYLIFISGVNVIGKPVTLPVTETHEVHPQTAYHASKYFGELLVNIANECGQNAASLRLSSPVGRGMPPNRIMAFFVKAALQDQPIPLIGKGTREQNYLDMRDLSALIERMIERRPNGLFNIASRERISNYNLARLCVETFDSKSEILFTNKPDPEEGDCWDISIEKAKKELGYRPVCSIEDSLMAIKERYENPAAQ